MTSWRVASRRALTVAIVCAVPMLSAAPASASHPDCFDSSAAEVGDGMTHDTPTPCVVEARPQENVVPTSSGDGRSAVDEDAAGGADSVAGVVVPSRIDAGAGGGAAAASAATVFAGLGAAVAVGAGRMLRRRRP